MTSTYLTANIWAAFATYDAAADAAGALLDHHVPKENLHLIGQDVPASYMSQGGRQALDQAEHGITVTTPADAASGAAKGLGIGLGAGVLAGLAALAVPGFGLVIGGGALATAAAGLAGTTAAGALAGGVAGYLRDQGAEEDVVSGVTRRLSAGDVIVHVEIAGTMSWQEAHAIIAKYGGVEVAADQAVSAVVEPDAIRTPR